MKPNSPNWVRGYLKPQRPSEKPTQAAPKPNRKKTENPFSDGLPAKIDAETLDLFDRIQLQHVIAECRRHPNMAAAGRALFNVSRLERATANDSDRLRKYLQRFGLTWADIR